MGLYGPDTIKQACADEESGAVIGADGRTRHLPHLPHMPKGPWETRLDSYDWSAESQTGRRASDSGDDVVGTGTDEPKPPADDAPPPSPIVVELEAINELVRYLERKFRHHR